MAAVKEVLDGETGDNDNPRKAGRDALAAMELPPDSVRLCVVQFLDAFERVKYFRHGLKQPIGLGPRGLRGDGMQQFDEGGEATVHEGSRLFFPGGLAYEGQHSEAPSFATAWRGGKSSRLYAVLAAHWKTKKTERALTQLALAALGDEAGAPLGGLALITGVSVS